MALLKLEKQINMNGMFTVSGVKRFYLNKECSCNDKGIHKENRGSLKNIKPFKIRGRMFLRNGEECKDFILILLEVYYIKYVYKQKTYT